MRISNLNELYNYIKTKEPLTTNGSLMQLCVCVDQYKNICNFEHIITNIFFYYAMQSYDYHMLKFLFFLEDRLITLK